MKRLAADHLAELLGEPYGTPILIFSIVAIEVMLISTRDARQRRADGRPGHDVRGDDDRAQRRDRALARRRRAQAPPRRSTACLVDTGIDTLRAAAALSGVLIATIVFTHEGISALKAAYRNQLQRTVNLCLGACLSTLGLTCSRSA